MSKIKTRFSDFINENLSNKEYIIGKKMLISYIN